MSQMILSFVLFTFGMSLLAVAYMLWQIPRRREPAYSLVVIWAFAAIFMAITAARFIFNASPAFAISAAYAVDWVLVRADFTTMRRTYRSLSAGSWRNAVRKSVKPRHILAVLGIVFLVLLPNVWWAVDASIPFELKSQYDQQVANLLPSFLRSPGYNPTSWTPFYFGAFGYGLPKATDYYPAAWQWFATQDASVPPELRPAFLSWWDYGFEAVDRGVHPTVADNFQDGYQVSGQFITAQNESAGIAILVVRLLDADFRLNHQNFRPAVTAALQAAGLPVAAIRAALLRPADYISIVLADPVTFGLWTPDLQTANALYIFLTNLLTHRLSEDGIVSLYHDVRDATGWNIGYFAVDARLFPVSATNTGIFYAPVKLSDHRVLNLPDGRVLPFEFFQILANTNRGQNIPIQFVAPGDQVQSQTIQYQSAFYNSMFYRAYIGYSPKDLNSTDTGVPGFSQPLQADPPVPAWNLTHWRVVYRTAYYNPFPDPSNHTGAWQAMNYDQAQRMQAAIQAGTIKGVVDLSTQSTVANGVVFLRYYDGAVVNGTVYAGSTPLPHVWVTVTDELGTPHYVTKSDVQGHYRAIVPFGNVTITASIGNLTRTTLVGERSLASVTLPVTIDQAMRTPADANGDGVPDWMISQDFHVASHTAQGTVFFDLNRDGSVGAMDVSAPGAPAPRGQLHADGHRRESRVDPGTDPRRERGHLPERHPPSDGDRHRRHDPVRHGAAVRDPELPVRFGSGDGPPSDVRRERTVLDPPPGGGVVRQRTVLRVDALVRDVRPCRRRQRRHDTVRCDVRPRRPAERYGERCEPRRPESGGDGRPHERGRPGMAPDRPRRRILCVPPRRNVRPRGVQPGGGLLRQRGLDRYDAAQHRPRRHLGSGPMERLSRREPEQRGESGRGDRRGSRPLDGRPRCADRLHDERHRRIPPPTVREPHLCGRGDRRRIRRSPDRILVPDSIAHVDADRPRAAPRPGPRERPRGRIVGPRAPGHNRRGPPRERRGRGLDPDRFERGLLLRPRR